MAVKMSYKISCVNFDVFSGKMAYLFFLKIEALISECVKIVDLVAKLQK